MIFVLIACNKSNFLVNIEGAQNLYFCICIFEEQKLINFPAKYFFLEELDPRIELNIS